MKTNKGLVEYAKKALASNSCYIYGSWGQKVTAKLIDEKAAQYPSMMNAKRVDYAKEHHIGKMCWDCSGLIKGYIMDGIYDSKQDKNARMMYNSCKEKGDIISTPEVPGILVFNKSLTHVGIYIGAGEVIEAKGFDYGLRKTKLTNFALWGKYPALEYLDQEKKSQEVAKKSQKRGKVTAKTGLNIRTGPSTSNPKTGAYNYGDCFDIIDERDGWYRTAKGWVCGAYVTCS